MSAEIDTEALEAAAIKALEDNIEDPDSEEEVGQREDVDEGEQEEEFDIDAALEGTEPVDLEGRITEDDAKERAIKRGWNENGQDKYGNRITAIEFLERTPFFKKMERMHSDIEAQDKKIRQLAEQSKLIAQKAVDDKTKLVAELKEAKENLLNNEILDQDNIAELKQIDKQIEENQVVEESEPEKNELAIEYEEKKEAFIQKNDWYEKDEALAAYADKKGIEYVTKYNEKHGTVPPPDELFKYLEDKIEKEYPTKTPKKSTRVAARNTRTVTSRQTNKKTLNDLPEEMRPVARMVMESAGLSEEEYLKTYEFD